MKRSIALLAAGMLSCAKDPALSSGAGAGSPPDAAPDVAPTASSAAPPGARAALSPDGQRAFDRLLAAERFESAYGCNNEVLSQDAIAVRTLVREGPAPAAFEELYDQATSAGRLYALAAFWYLRPAEFPALVETLRSRRGAHEVEAQNGCKVERSTVAGVLERDPRVTIQLRPGAGAYELTCSAPRGKPFSVDFAGGGLPIEIVQGAEMDAGACTGKAPPLPPYLLPRPR